MLRNTRMWLIAAQALVALEGFAVEGLGLGSTLS